MKIKDKRKKIVILIIPTIFLLILVAFIVALTVNNGLINIKIMKKSKQSENGVLKSNCVNSKIEIFEMQDSTKKEVLEIPEDVWKEAIINRYMSSSVF